MSQDYVSAACRAEGHDDCQSHPVVLCACPCHQGERTRLALERRLRLEPVLPAP